MTPETEASRTLVKSPPELWAEVSDPSSLARHLDGFGEIRITRLEPETAVAWEGAQVSGTVRLEPSGWGTRVLLTAKGAGPEAEPLAAAPDEAEAQAAPEPPVEPEPLPPAAARSQSRPPGPARRPGLFGRLLAVLRGPAPPDLELHSRPPGPAPAPPAPVAARPAPPVPAAIEVPKPPAPAASELSEQPVPVVAETPELPVSQGPVTEAALKAALDSLGQAHHRPFSRA